MPGGDAESHRDTAVDSGFETWLQDFILIPTRIHLLLVLDGGETIMQGQL